MKLQLKEVYTRLRVVHRRKAGSSELEIDVDDIFGSSEEDNDPLVLVEGSPGFGKTTFCLKLAHDWANGAMPRNFPSFRLVFLLKCRDMKGNIAEDVVEEIFEQLLPEDLKEKTKEALVEFLKDLDNQKQILIILDGLDELPKESEDRVNKVLARKRLSLCYVLTTTRQGKGIDTRKQFTFDSCLEIKGFTEENSFEYIRKHFRDIGTEHSSKGERLIQEVNRNSLLSDLSRNPLNLLLLCVVYEDHEGSLPSSSTELYQTIVRCLLRRYCAREELKASESDEDLDKQFEITILALGRLAWKGLLNDRLSFYEDELEELERSNENIVARRLGFVYKEESLKRYKPRHAYSFPHKTFQEYLAASYIADKFRGSEFQVLEQILFPKFARIKFKQVFVFVCGILREEATIPFEQIGSMLQKQWDWLKCDLHTAAFLVDSSKETGNAERMAKTLCLVLPFPRSLHLWNLRQSDVVWWVLEECAEISEVHLAGTVFGLKAKFLERPDVKSVILYCFSELIDCRTLVHHRTEKLTFALSADVGCGVSKVPDMGVSSVRLRICGSLGSSSLQDVESLLLNKRLSSLSITVCGDVQESLVEALARGLAGESAVKFLDLCVNGNFSFDGAYLLEKGMLRNRSLTNVKISVNGEPPENWQAVAKNLHAQFAEKAIVSAIYPNTFSKVKDSQVTHLNRFLSKTDLKQQTVTLNVWGELSGDGRKAVCEVLLHSPVSHLTLNIHGPLTDEIFRCTASCVKEQEKLSSLTINAWVEMTEKETKLIKELGLDKNPSFSLNVHGTSAPLKEPIDSKVISSDEPQSVVAFFKKATKGPSKFTEGTSQKSITMKISDDGDMSDEWEHDLGEGLAGDPSLKSITMEIDNYGDTSKEWGRGLGEGLARNTSLKSLTLQMNDYGSMSKADQRRGLARNTSLGPLTIKINNDYYTSNEWEHGFREGLAGNTSLESLTLEIDDCGETNREWGRGVGEGLARYTSSKSLTLQINKRGDTDKEWGRCLGEGLARNTSLKSLTLQINNRGDTSKEWGRGLGEGLARNTSLKSLTLKINNRGDTDKEWGRGLGMGLARNISLESLTVEINNDDYTSNEWEHGFGEGLAVNTSLKSLTLEINDCCGTSKEWGGGLGEGLARNTSLKSLTLQIDNRGDTEKEWGGGLGEGLARNISLESLTIKFNNDEHSNHEWEHGFGEGLAVNTSLKSLTLEIDDCGEKSYLWGCGLGEGLARNTSLKSLALAINNHDGDTFHEWGDVVGESLAKNISLNSLTLTINNYSYMSDGWSVSLAEGLERNTSLKSITLTMNNYFYMSSAWELDLFEGSARNTSLRSITLVINNYGNMKGELGHGLVEGLIRNTSLKSITLAIHNYGYMKGEWGDSLVECLARNTSLTSITLAINNYCYMSNVWGLGLAEGLARNTSLNSLTLAASNYGDMSKEWWCALREGLRKSKSLTECNLIVNICGKC